MPLRLCTPAHSLCCMTCICILHHNWLLITHACHKFDTNFDFPVTAPVSDKNAVKKNKKTMQIFKIDFILYAINQKQK